MNAFAESFVELLDANDEEIGSPQFVLVNGKKKRAIIEQIPNDDVMLGGGIGEAGQFRVQVLKSEFAQQPETGDTINVRGKEFDIVSTTEVNNAVFILTAGDLSTGTA